MRPERAWWPKHDLESDICALESNQLMSDKDLYSGVNIHTASKVARMESKDSSLRALVSIDMVVCPGIGRK